MSHYKVSKVNGTAYLQVWSGDIKGKGSLIRTVGRADKLLQNLVRLDVYDRVTKKYPDILTKLIEEEN